jgi:predicted site-specific integrase-resolvase
MFTPKQLAERAGVSTNLIYGWCQAGLLPHLRLGAPGKRGKILITEEDWAAFLAAHRVVGSGLREDPVTRPVPRFKHVKLRPPGG